MKTVLFLAAALICAAVQPAIVPANAQTHYERPDEPEDLPAGPGRDDTFYSCAACHGLAIVVRQGLPREGWADMIKLMYARHGMAELDEASEAAILDYLAAHFPPRRRAPANPFLR